MCKVYIIILNWNGYKDTVECLQSLRKVSFYSYEVIVVDNGSTDGSPSKLKKEFKDIIYLDNKKNLGFAGGNNVGIKYALDHDADHVLLLNNDTIVGPDFLEKLVRTSESDHKIGITGPKIYAGKPPSTLLWYAGGVFNKRRVKFIHRGFHEEDKGKWDRLEDVDFVSGCAMLINRAVLERIGLLDEKYFLYYEDTDFCTRAQKAGFRICYVPEAVIWHNAWTSSGGQSSPLRLYYMSRNRLLFMQEHLDKKTKRHFIPYFIYDAILRRAIYLLVKRKSPLKGICALFTGLADFKKKKFYQGPSWIHQRKDNSVSHPFVAMFPYLDDHPYLRLLAEGLERQGVFVEKNVRWFPMWLFRRGVRMQVLHFHWPSLYYQSKKLPVLTIYRIPLFFVFAFLARLFNYRIVWTVHNLYPHESVLPDFLEQWIRSFWVNKIVDHMIVHCTSAEKMVRQEFKTGKPVSVIHHGHFIGYYPDGMSREDARERLKISMGSFVYLHFGLIKGYKGIEGLMDVFKKIKGSDDCLIIAGRPVDRKVCQDIERKADSQFMLRLDSVKKDELQIYFKACDVVVLPYKDILTSGNLLLSMSFGRPVIIPAVGCIPETIDSESGVLYNPVDTDTFEKAMRSVKGMDLEKMGQNAYEKAKQYDWDTIAKKTKAVYERYEK